MPTQYQSQEGKINEFLKDVIIPAIKKKRDIDYDKVVKSICLELGVKEDKIKECIARFIEMGKINEEHILTIPDNQVQDWLNNVIKEEKEEKKEAKKVDEILNIKKKKK